MPGHERGLVAFLRFFGCMTLLAVYAVVQPRSWMAATHEWLGLGALPEGPIVSYLARSLSAFYALLGGALVLFSTDVRRYRPALVYVSTAIVLLGVALFFIDLNAGLPSSWIWGEGPLTIVLGLVMGWLVRSVPTTRVSPD
jgi:hypothetical protein